MKKMHALFYINTMPQRRASIYSFVIMISEIGFFQLTNVVSINGHMNGFTEKNEQGKLRQLSSEQKNCYEVLPDINAQIVDLTQNCPSKKFFVFCPERTKSGVSPFIFLNVVQKWTPQNHQPIYNEQSLRCYFMTLKPQLTLVILKI